MRAAVAIGLSVFALSVLLTGACRQGPSCHEGDFEGCLCEDGTFGYRRCVSEDEGYGACVCDGTTPGLDGSFDDVSSGEPDPHAKLPYMSTCTTNEECETGICHLFAQRGSFCTKNCEDITDCPAPSGGCNNRGLCRAP